MKSIKEKAEEVFPVEEYDTLETELQRRKMRVCYEHGANYVLEELEKTIERAEYYSDMSLKSRFYEDLKYMIQELKK